MRKSAKIITALSVTGLAVVAGSAFTGAGLGTSGQAATAQFIGGKVSQAVTGATLQGLTYGFSNDAKTSVNLVTLSFSTDASNKTASVVLTDGSGAAVPVTCAQDGTPDANGVYTLAVGATDVKFTCTPTTSVTGVQNASVTVNSVNA